MFLITSIKKVVTLEVILHSYIEFIFLFTIMLFVQKLIIYDNQMNYMYIVHLHQISTTDVEKKCYFLLKLYIIYVY